MRERRKYTRKLIKLDVVYDMSTDQRWSESTARDIGAGGICLITKDAISIGKSFDLKFFIPDMDKPIKVIGKVMWNEKAGDETENQYYNGIEFIKIHSDDKELIMKFVESATFERR
ncbi:MAG: PilZ domain-containing protein [Spirochaetales bacterium]|nr:PilZ domain-containing protein [Spirochaetales bacterium]